jgi:cysteine desulfurase
MYLDFAATSPINKIFIDSINNNIELYANPSSNHILGFNARNVLKETKRNIIENLNEFNINNTLGINRLLMTSGATESINTVINAFSKEDSFYIYTDYEHKAVDEAICKYSLKQYNSKISVKDVTKDDFKNSNPKWYVELRKKIHNNPTTYIVINIVTVNNETGDIFPSNIVKSLKSRLETDFPNSIVVIHLDHTQGYMKVPYDLSISDFITFSGHKLGTFKGIGGLFYNSNYENILRKNSLLVGGDQQSGMRAGTENVLFVKALSDLVSSIKYNMNEYDAFDYFKCNTVYNELDNIAKEFKLKLHINYQRKFEQSPFILNFSYIGIEGESVLSALYDDCISTTSACNSDSLEPSHVLSALGLDKVIINCAIRFSMDNNTDSHTDIIDFINGNFKKAIQHLSRIRIRDLK